jgi:glycosyltransferase involved in cell wall biosynthesis
MEKVSIIVPVYNGEKYLEETIKNILDSTYKNIELILIDDGSSDNSFYICQEYSNRDNRIRAFCHENAGVAETRNKGIRLATGNYICFCDQDDRVDSSMYEKMYKRIIQDASDIAICGTGKLIGEKIQEFEKFSDTTYYKKEIIEKLIYAILFDGYKGYGDFDIGRIGNSIWKCMIKRELIASNEIQFKKFIDYEDDRTFLLELLCHAERVSLLAESLYFWRINLQSETYRRKYIFEMKEKMQKYSCYEQKILLKSGMDSQMIEEYLKVERCNNLVQLVDNEYGDVGKKSLWEKSIYLRQEACRWGVKDCSVYRRKLKIKLIKKRGVLFFLEKNCAVGAYLFVVFYQKIRRIGLKHSLWTIIEQKASVK